MPPRRPRKPPDPLADELIESAQRGDVARVQELLSRGARPDAEVAGDGPLLCGTSRDGHWDVAFALIRAGADVNAQDRDSQYTPLFWAVLRGNVDAVRKLLELRADPRVKDRWGNIPLAAACDGIGMSRQRLDPTVCREIARLFLAAGCDPDEPNNGGMTPRMIALDPNLKSPVADLFRELPPHGVGGSAVAAAGTAPVPMPPSSTSAPATSPAPEGDAARGELRRVQGLVRAGVATRAEMLEILLDELGADGDDEVARVTADLDREIASKAVEESSWPAVLDTDRLDRAFEALEKHGVLCLHDAGYTQSDGFGDAEERRDEEGGDTSGYDAYCFYHRQDVEGAVDGLGLYIAFGAFKSKQGDVKIGRKIEYRLEEAGLRVVWDGTAESRLHLPEFDFRRRGVPAT